MIKNNDISKETKFKELADGSTLHNGKYIIKRVLGMGGFGITYYAKHNTLDQYYAIKEFFINGCCIRNTHTYKVHLQGITEEDYNKYKGKFIEEAQTLVKLKHPNIAEVVDFFSENETYYMVMHFVEGITLQQLVEQEGVLDYEIAINYIAQLSNAITYIHERNILHRDVKPSNIIITPDYRAVLIDFGSAREFVHDKMQNHTAILTKGYAPLEQYSSMSKKGSYSDIYSLGAVFYFALTGQIPIDAAARTIEPLPEPKELRQSIPKEANHTIIKAMQLKPEDRYQFVSEFMDDLLKRGKKIERTKEEKKERQERKEKEAERVEQKKKEQQERKEQEAEKAEQERKERQERKEQEAERKRQEKKERQEKRKRQGEKGKNKIIIWIGATFLLVAFGVALFFFTPSNGKTNESPNDSKQLDTSDKPNSLEQVITLTKNDDNKEVIIDEKNAPPIAKSPKEEITPTKPSKENIVISEPQQQQKIDQIEEIEQQHGLLELQETLNQANNAFNSAQYEKAFELYKKVPNDDTGYNNFMALAKKIISVKGYDLVAEKLLLKAKELKNTSEVNKLLSNYN